MEENKIKINSYSVNQLQNDFIGLKKNPQKYVNFQLNAENTTHPDAGGLYELLPYYQKINPLGEKANYAIQWYDFENKWKLIKVNPLGDLPRLDVEETTIAILLEGDQFSRPTTTDIKAYTTYEQMKEVVKTVGEKNKELKMKILEMEEEIVHVQTKSNDKMIALQEANEKLEETLTKIKKQNIKLKAYALEQNNIAKKENEEKKIQAEENEKILEELENLKSNLKEKEIQIEKKNEENRALEIQKGDLAYKLSDSKDYEHKFLSLEKEIKPLKALIKHCKAETLNSKEKLIQIEKKNEENCALEMQKGELKEKQYKQKFLSLEKQAKQIKVKLKYYQAEKQKSEEDAKQLEAQVCALHEIFNSQVAEIHNLTEELNSCNNDTQIEIDIFRKYKQKNEKKIKQIQSNWEKNMKESPDSIQKDIKQLKAQVCALHEIFNSQVAEIHNLTEELNSCNHATEIEKDLFKKYKQKKEKEMKQIHSNWEKDMEESLESIHKDIENCDENNFIKISKKLKKIYSAANNQLNEEIHCQKELLTQQTDVINDQEHNINFKDLAIEFLLNLLQTRLDVIYPQLNEMQNGGGGNSLKLNEMQNGCDDSSNSPQTHIDY